jgi:drug/metabolite transporter (DMT)-like permease
MGSNDAQMTLLPGMFIVFLTVVFGANAVAIKLTLTGMGPLTAAGLRFALAAVAIACWARVTDRSFTIRREQLIQVAIVSLAFTCQLSLFYLGLKRTHASRGVLFSNLLPFIVLFLSHRFIPGERVTWKQLVGCVLGFVGVVFMFVDGSGLSKGFRVGDLIILTAVLIWSGNVVFTKRIIDDFAPFQLVLYPMIVSVPIFLSAGFFWDDRMVFKLDSMVIGAYFYQSLISAAFGFVAWNTMLKRFGASTLHSFLFIMPIAGVLISGLLLNEPITPNLLVALTFIAAGIATVHISPRRPAFSLPPTRGI